MYDFCLIRISGKIPQIQNIFHFNRITGTLCNQLLIVGKHFSHAASHCTIS